MTKQLERLTDFGNLVSVVHDKVIEESFNHRVTFKLLNRNG